MTATPDPFATFRPRRGRVVTSVMAGVVVLIFLIGAITVPGPREGGPWRLPDRLMLLVVGGAIAWLLRRYATIRATPTRERLVVRNLLVTRRLEWPEIVGIQFAGGDPWVQLDLTDTERLAVMAIQKADGAFGRAEASRLASLIRALGEGAEEGSADPSA